MRRRACQFRFKDDAFKPERRREHRAYDMVRACAEIISRGRLLSRHSINQGGEYLLRKHGRFSPRAIVVEVGDEKPFRVPRRNSKRGIRARLAVQCEMSIEAKSRRD